MKLDGKHVVVTGGARGIGKALCDRFAAEGARVVVADRLEEQAQATASAIDGLAVGCDVSKESDIIKLVATAEAQFGPVDPFCSNAGLFREEKGHAASASNADWETNWQVHVMSQVYAARAVLPGMIERGEGYLLNMASAAGLLSQIGNAAYSTTKHASVGFSESLSITHRDDGIRVSVICPQFVATSMLGYDSGSEAGIDDVDGLIRPEQLAETVVRGLEKEEFLILPHPDVAQFIEYKATQYDGWLEGMRKLRRKIISKLGSTNSVEMHKHI